MRADPVTKSIYDFICQFVAEHGYAPSLREIGKGCFVAHGSVMRHLDKLEAWGWIEREPGRARSIIVVKHPPRR
jgi:repressor LexA